jgi:hypothetical protein
MRTPNFYSLNSLALIAAGLVSLGTSQVQAGASNKNGNPFGNGTFFQTTGTFSAVIRGENLSGTMLFSSGVGTNGASTNSSGGSCVISYLGGRGTNDDGTIYENQPGLYNGNSAGMWDPSSGSISGQFWGGYTLSGTNSTVVYPEIYNTNNYPVPINVVSNVVIPPTAGAITNGVVVPGAPGTNYTVTNIIYVEPIGSNSFKNSVFLNGSFDGSIQNKYPNQTFSAQGKLAIQQLSPPQQGTNADGSNNYAGSIPVQMAAPTRVNISVQGVRISDTYSSFNLISNAIPYSITTYSITNITSLQQGQ